MLAVKMKQITKGIIKNLKYLCYDLYVPWVFQQRLHMRLATMVYDKNRRLRNCREEENYSIQKRLLELHVGTDFFILFKHITQADVI